MDIFQDDFFTAIEARQFSKRPGELRDQAININEPGLDRQTPDDQRSVGAIGLGIEATHNILAEQYGQHEITVAPFVFRHIAFQGVVESEALLQARTRDGQVVEGVEQADAQRCGPVFAGRCGPVFAGRCGPVFAGRDGAQTANRFQNLGQGEGYAVLALDGETYDLR